MQIKDVYNLEDNTEVTISGIVIDKFKTREHLVITVKDISGTIRVNIQTNVKFPTALFWKGNRLQIKGCVIGIINLNGNEEKRICNISNVLLFSKSESNKIVSVDELDHKIAGKASQIMMSAICRCVSSYFDTNEFIEFESRLISYTWEDDGLETLKVIYPGFGAPVTLITSPSAQIMDFIKTAMVSRAYTVTTSFETTYRFKNGSTETRVIMAKALDFTINDLVQTLKTISKRIIDKFSENDDVPRTFGDDIIVDSWKEIHVENDNKLHAVIYDTSFVSSNGDKISQVIHIIDCNDNILAEGAIEFMYDDLSIATITIYPSQFCELLKKAPARQLQELWRKYDRS